MKRIGLTASEEKSFENVDDGRTDDVYLYILKAHLLAFGSGELKTSCNVSGMLVFAKLRHCFTCNKMADAQEFLSVFGKFLRLLGYFRLYFKWNH